MGDLGTREVKDRSGWRLGDMGIPGLEIVRHVELSVDAATARATCTEYHRTTVLPRGVSVLRFGQPFLDAVAMARSARTARTFLRFDAEGESGWLAVDEIGHVIGHCWRLDNRGKGVVKRQVPILPGWSWLQYEWTAPAWRGQGIMPALLSMSIREALAQPTWFVQGFLTDIAVTNHASQRSSAKVGFAPVACVTSLCVYRRWFLLHSEHVGDAMTQDTSV